MKKTIIVASLASALGVGGTLGAQAATSTLSTTSRTETLISSTCYHEHQVTKTYFAWNTKKHAYVAYVAPKTTTTDSTHCHA